MGRAPTGAQTRRTTGFSRADARRSRTPRPGRRDEPRLLRRRPRRLFFEGLLIRRGRGFRVARPRLLDRPADRLQRLPAALNRDLLQTQLGGHPVRDLAARPDPAGERRLVQTHTKALKQLRLQDRRDAAIAAPKIAQSGRPERVVAFDQLFDPAKPERRDLGHFPRRMPLGDQIDRLKMPRRPDVLGRLVTRFQLRNAQMLDDPSHARLPRIMAIPSISPMPPQESPTSESITRKPYDATSPSPCRRNSFEGSRLRQVPGAPPTVVCQRSLDVRAPVLILF